jgi:adenylate cyclase class 2
VIERERKYRLTDLDLLRLATVLDRLAASPRREVQDTTHFASADRRVGLNVRLRATGGRLELTVKGPRLESGLSKVREEHTVVVEGDVAPFLAALGLVPTERYRKHTTIYAFDGALVSLDEVEDLGAFCEIEAADESTIERVAKALDLSDKALERRGYARLVRLRAPS